jgi:hypothetical protein
MQPPQRLAATHGGELFPVEEIKLTSTRLARCGRARLTGSLRCGAAMALVGSIGSWGALPELYRFLCYQCGEAETKEG